jgi:predicted nuclease of restriction endonuclease-like (RecB) superfamily
MSKAATPANYVKLIEEIKSRIAQAQLRAVHAVNSELVRLYWDIGRLIDRQQKQRGWGAGVIPRLARELRNELPELKSFSERNILKLRCFIVIDLKKGEFKPEYAGKMNFYLAVADDRLRHSSDAPSIGLILCQDRNQIVAEYALRAVDRPIGISEYELTRALPASLQSALPTVEEIEAELSEIAVKPKPPEAKALPAPTVSKRTSPKRSLTKRKKTGSKK